MGLGAWAPRSPGPLSWLLSTSVVVMPRAIVAVQRAEDGDHERLPRPLLYRSTEVGDPWLRAEFVPRWSDEYATTRHRSPPSPKSLQELGRFEETAEESSGQRRGQKAVVFSNPTDERRAASPCYEIPLSRVQIPSPARNFARLRAWYRESWSQSDSPGAARRCEKRCEGRRPVAVRRSAIASSLELLRFRTVHGAQLHEQHFRTTAFEPRDVQLPQSLP